MLLLMALVAGSAHAEPDATPTPTPPPRRALSSDNLSAAEFAFVRDFNGRRLWSSHVAPVARGGHQAIELLDGSGEAFAPVARAKLPAELKPLAGARVRLYSADGKECEVKLEHWGILAEFNPVPEGEEGEPSPSELARRAFSTDESAVLSYAVDITAASKHCGEVLWARLATLPQVPSYPVEELKGKALGQLRPLLRKTKAFVEAQQRYRQELKGSWDRHQFTAFSGYAAQVESTRYLVGNLHNFEGCDSFAGDAIGVFEQAAAGYREHPNAMSVPLHPVRAVDLNGDGFPEWISEYYLVGWDGTELRILRDVEPESWWCPC